MSAKELRILALVERILARCERFLDDHKSESVWTKPKMSHKEAVSVCPRGSRAYFDRMRVAGWVTADENGLYDTNEVRLALSREDKLPKLPTAADAVWRRDLTTDVHHLLIGKKTACGSRNTGWGKPSGERLCSVCQGFAKRKKIALP